MNSLGIYIHIPFCFSKCPYCDFYSYAFKAGDRESYAAALAARLRALGDTLSGYRIDTVYFGGGTPGVMQAADLCDILFEIKAYNISGDAELTLETNPGAADEKDLFLLRRAGFNRISLGMQSSADSELLSIGRVHRDADTARAVTAARRAGFENISLDLMLGLPGQTAQSLRESIYAAAERSEHISAYILKLEPGTPLEARYKNGIKDDDEQADLYLFCCEALSSLGFTQYEISNFARPGYFSRHNSRYWNLREYIGLGPGAHSFFNGRRFFFPRDTAHFINPNSADVFSGAREEEIDLKTEYIMLSLRTSAGISERELERWGISPAPVLKTLEKYREPGYVIKTRDGCRLTPKGFLISNTIIADALSAV